MPRVKMTADQKRELGRDKRKVQNAEYAIFPARTAVEEAARAWLRETETGRAADAVFETWLNRRCVLQDAAMENEYALLATVVQAASTAAGLRVRAEAARRGVTSAATYHMELPRPGEFVPVRRAVSKDELLAASDASTVRAAELEAQLFDFPARKAAACAELELHKKAEPSREPVGDTPQAKAYDAACDALEAAEAEWKTQQSAIAAKRARFMGKAAAPEAESETESEDE